MQDRNRNRPNALKHGAFAKVAILPGEDRQEFARLLSAVVEEWAPVGPTEEDAVLTIAKCIWRKQRVQIYLNTMIDARGLDPKRPGYDCGRALRAVSTYIGAVPEGFDKALNEFLPTDAADYLRTKFPRENFESISAWVSAVQSEITLVLLPKAERDSGPKDAVSLMHSGEILSEDIFKQELAVDERIDGMMDRAIKRLIHTKTMKHMLAIPSTGADQVTSI